MISKPPVLKFRQLSIVGVISKILSKFRCLIILIISVFLLSPLSSLLLGFTLNLTLK